LQKIARRGDIAMPLDSEMGGASNVEILNAVVVWRLISRSSMFHRILLRSAYHC
jgi:hypothetical protein